MTAEDRVISQFIESEGVELSVELLVMLTKMPANTVRVSITRIMKGNKLNNLVRTGYGRYTFKPNDYTKIHETSTQKLHRLLNEVDSIGLKEIAKELDVHENYVHELVSKVRRRYGVKVQRKVIYEVIK
ncbi:winged helix-turn-helix DNA-binding domain protein [Vibrio phage 1.291.O._10N.286.55.F6]|nr:winged helix-turn-helix DNA-binding domain protein [Vibrio phage 1.291.O._10N.286.55.F6]